MTLPFCVSIASFFPSRIATSWVCATRFASAQSVWTRGRLERLLGGPRGEFANPGGEGGGERLQVRRQALLQDLATSTLA